MNKHVFILFCTVLLGFSACEDDPQITITTPDPSPGIDTSQVVPISNPTIINAPARFLDGDSEYIFDDDKLHTFELTLSPEALNEIDSDPAAEEYVEGSMTFENETIGPVGIRYKGSIGAFVDCLSGGNWSRPSGSKTCTKLSMKIKINWNGSDNKFFGMKKMQFHSMNLDDSQMRDRLGYSLFREMGVKAPRCTHARLVINGVYSGVYAMIEVIDGRFVKHNFDDTDGNLYKEVWPLLSDGTATPQQYLIESLKTNEDENPSTEIITSFANEVIEASTDTQLKSAIDKWMNVNDIMSYVVVDRLIRADDGPFHWYCGGGNCTNHNYYWCENPEDNTIHLIPWDLDNAFENIINNVNPVTPIADEWGQSRNNCEPFNFGFFGLSQWSANCDKITRGWALYDAEYLSHKTRFKEGPFSQNAVDAKLEKWRNQIEEATQEADNNHSDAISISQWNNAINTLKNQLAVARRN